MASSNYTIALVGNPNCGKTTLFNALTGSKQHVGNWPGVTVEKKSGHYRLRDVEVEVVDLPGTYSLDVVDQEVSLDELVARNYVDTNDAQLIINIVDASNLERNLYLSSQLAEMQVPMLVVLNMVDVAESKGIRVDAAALAQQWGCPVVPVVAASGKGIAALKEAIHTAAQQPGPASAKVQFCPELEAAIAALLPAIEATGHRVAPRWLAVRLLEGDDLALRQHPPAVIAQARQLSAQLGEDIDIMLADARYSLANRIVGSVVTRDGQVGVDLTERIDRIVLHRVLGIPIFLFMMYLMFMFTIRIGGAFIDFFDQFASVLLVDGFTELLKHWNTPTWLQVLLAKGIGAGVQVVATFIPIVGFLFLFLSILEDSGYMARAAFVMDRFMRWVGLPGKSFVPLIVGFGCNVPAIMATRTLENRRDRLMTIAMAPFMSCGARLPVYVLFAAAFFAEQGQNVVFALYLIGIVMAVLTGLILKKTLLQGEVTPFIMELPPYHRPTVKNVLMHTWDRLKGFIFRAGSVIVPMVLVLNILNTVGSDGSFGNEDTEQSVLAAVGRSIAPAFSPMGLNADNWPAAVGIFTGVLAKEAVVGTLNATYSALAEKDANTAAEEKLPFDLAAGLIDAFATIPKNLIKALGDWADPLQLGTSKDTNIEAVAESQHVAASTFGAMAMRFDGEVGAFAYLLFILLYMPCTAAIAAVYQEAGGRWALFVGFWTTGLAYALSTIFYQAATWSRHPSESLGWIVGFLVAQMAVLYGLRRQGQREMPIKGA